ncbi:hypothetical protein PO909_010784 [Leuciscus waleckii]
MAGASRGITGRMNREMEERGLTPPLQVHCLIHQQALCCKVLKWESVKKVVVSCINFIRANGLMEKMIFSTCELVFTSVLCSSAFVVVMGKTVPELIDTEWKWDLAFLTDVTEMLNGLNVQLQGIQRFRELHVHAKEIHLFQNPFAADIDEALPSYQIELAELMNCDVLKDAFQPNSLIEFYTALPNETYPNIKRNAMKMSTLFGRTYICEQTFSHMKLMKNPMRSRLTDEHLYQSLRLAVTEMEPDIGLLTSQKQAHSSH